MSLILTKSTAGHPASYVNRFKNTFEIKANAEIAVHEVVINRSKKFVVGTNARLYVRHGDAANVNLWNTPQVVRLLTGTYDPTEMAAHLQLQLNTYDSHPQWQGGWTCAATQVSGEFAKFTITANQKPAENSTIPTAANLKLLFGTKPGDGKVVYEPSDGTLTANSSLGTFSYAKGETPISLNSGEFVVKIVTGTDIITVGLSCLPNAVTASYFVTIDNVTGFISLFHTLSRETGKPYIQPIDYGDLQMVDSTNDHVKFKVENDIVTVSIGTAANPDSVVLSNSMVAVNNVTYAMYPYIQIRSSSVIQLISFKSNLMFTKHATSRQQVYNNHLTNNALIFATLQLGNLATRQGVSSGYLSSATSIIVNPVPSWGITDANMAEELGFDDATVTATNSTTSKEDFVSNNVPDRSGSDEIMYVRLTGLTFASHNGVSGGPSRILQPLARFTDNKTFGRMHFIPPERTYLKLNNPVKLTVQEIQIDLVNSNEQIVADLLDYTFVSLHIK